MPASKTNYIVIYKGSSQVYGCSTKQIALESPPPIGKTMSDKKVLFMTFHPDEERLVVHKVPDEEVQTAELKYPKPKPKKIKDES